MNADAINHIGFIQVKHVSGPAIFAGLFFLCQKQNGSFWTIQRFCSTFVAKDRILLSR